MKTYKIEYWFLSRIDESYDYNIVEVKAISPSSAIKKAKMISSRFAKNFKILKNEN